VTFRPTNPRPAFTLIEVMIAVLILALGLLGLGAIIPVIVHEQRRSSEMTLGVACARAAEGYLRSRADLNPAAPCGWDKWIDDVNWSPPPPPGTGPGNPVDLDNFDSYRWRPLDGTGTYPEINPTPVPNWQTGNANTPASGDILLRRDAVTGQIPAVFTTISVKDRLWPTRAMQTTDSLTGRDAYRPIFVWDFIARRVPNEFSDASWIGGVQAPAARHDLQIAIFVRRIDSVRIPKIDNLQGEPATLSDILTGNLQTGDLPIARLPVAVSTADGLPTNTGMGVYSTPVFMTAELVPNMPRDRLQLSDAESTGALLNDANAFRLASQPGQQLVDNLGNIYTVRGVVEGTTDQVQIDPQVPAGVRDFNSANSGTHGLKQVAFTPQVPAAVHLFTISRPSR
jgi:prepilin-type N-terminal cleavage/methylation domain-containing protein